MLRHGLPSRASPIAATVPRPHSGQGNHEIPTELLRVSRFESLTPSTSPLPNHDADPKAARRYHRPAADGSGPGGGPPDTAAGGDAGGYFGRPASPMLPAMISRGRIFAPLRDRGGGGAAGKGGGGGGGWWSAAAASLEPAPGPARTGPEVPWIVNNDRRDGWSLP